MNRLQEEGRPIACERLALSGNQLHASTQEDIAHRLAQHSDRQEGDNLPCTSRSRHLCPLASGPQAPTGVLTNSLRLARTFRNALASTSSRLLSFRPKTDR